MAKFVIECPNCGNYAQASSGLFGFIGGTRTVSCSCGHVIDVKAEKLSSRECPNCGNHVVFDQSKGEKALCPVCSTPINTLAEQNKTVEFSCARCGIRLRASRTAQSHTCPVCDCRNDVAQRLKQEELSRSALTTAISYGGSPDTLVWRHPVEDFCSGTHLVVDESQEAIFFRDGRALDPLPAGQYILETHRMPMLSALSQEHGSPYRAKIYFINLITHMGIKWGVGNIRLYEPAYNLPVTIGLHGTFNLRVIDSRRLLLKVVGTGSALTRNQLMDANGTGYFRDMIVSQIRSHMAAAIRGNGIDLMLLDENSIELSAALLEVINPSLKEYGLRITEFFIEGIQMPTDPAFKRALSQHSEEILTTRQMDMEARINYAAQNKVSSEHDLQLLRARHQAELQRIQAESQAQTQLIMANAKAQSYLAQATAEAEEMKRKGYTYQQETARQVGLNSTVFCDPALLDNAIFGSDAWDCTCGQTGNTGKCCTECGAKRPAPVTLWDCPACGQRGNRGKFCSECGAGRPAASWDCPQCGTKGNKGKCCPECGFRR